MYKQIITLCFLVFFVITGITKADGDDIVVFKKDGSVVKGELLLVKENGIIVSTISGLRESKFIENKNSLVFLRFSNINTIELKGNSHLVSGALYGASALSLLFLSQSGGNKIGSVPAGGALLIGSVLGGLVGGIVGAITSSSDRILSNIEPDFISELKEAARYEDENAVILQNFFK